MPFVRRNRKGNHHNTKWPNPQVHPKVSVAMIMSDAWTCSRRVLRTSEGPAKENFTMLNKEREQQRTNQIGSEPYL
ncbi:hypothetical protein NEOLI_004254 [Neolecta irregularis DAH-3]|uniref:Uncharacterized protein n=1 Tax=Neolecta irregularis (strain DAH-3) TaxID=1198029 RepID=A0A1U7LTP6_NEOID|nr:hypothetical protein NEOLI_004254 [Neolecta irregularis DAH-3]|eukprot:OLL26040.1 hypothetical protein NEOLI_004254 [Neolecta irregularis DAH-3]